MVKALLHRFHGNEDLLRFLPSTIATSVHQKKEIVSIDFPSVLCIKKWVLPIHYSWFEKPLKELPKESLPLFLSLFSSGQATGLCKLLNLTPPTQKPSGFTQLFLSHYLKNKMLPQSVLPQELIPNSPMSSLLKISQKHLLILVDLLGLYDLAADMKQIVDKQLLQKVQSVLSSEQNQFLQYCSQRPSKWVSPRLGLSGWNGEKKTLETLLHSRGLSRLAKAMAQEEVSYRWYLVHRFDTSRGNILLKELKNPVDAHLVPFFKGQVFDILQRFK